MLSTAKAATISAGDQLFWRLWAVAALTHMIARPTGAGEPLVRGAMWVLAITAIAQLVAPRMAAVRVAYALAVIASFVVRTPTNISNHWAIAAVVALATLLDRSAWRGRPTMAPGLVLIVAYGFSAFAKLNESFFDPATSCAVYLADSAVSVVGWSIDESHPVAVALPWLGAGAELVIFVLLAIPRTRRWGAVIGMVFHLLLTLDIPNRFYDFTGVLMPLFILLAGTGDAVAAALTRVFGKPKGLLTLIASVLGIVAVMSIEWLGLAFIVGRVVVAVGWFVVMGVVVVTSVRAVVDADPPPVRNLPALALVAVALTGLNGLTPYLEVKTTFGFNMYSNLRTDQGQTNHLIVPRTRPSPRFETLVEVIESEDPFLAEYVDSGFLLPLESLRGYTAERPDVGLVYRIEEETIDELDRSPGSLLSEPVPWLRHRFGYLRSVDTEEPKRCESSYLPLT